VSDPAPSLRAAGHSARKTPCAVHPGAARLRWETCSSNGPWTSWIVRRHGSRPAVGPWT